MKKEDVLNGIMRIIGSFKHHSYLLQELVDLLANTGAELAFFKLLTLRLAQLTQLGVNAVRLKEFEPLGGGLYSMHLAGKTFNIRILYSFLKNREPVLLLAFYERENKKNTDYTNHIQPALDRLKTKKEGQ